MQKPYKNIDKTDKTDPGATMVPWQPGWPHSCLRICFRLVLLMCLYVFFIVRLLQKQKPYKYIHNIDKIDPEGYRICKNHTKTLIKLIKLILRQLWCNPGCQGAIVVSGSVLLVLLMFLYGFCNFGDSQDQFYQFYQCFCMVFHF